jgi:hypothetical protein
MAIWLNVLVVAIDVESCQCFVLDGLFALKTTVDRRSRLFTIGKMNVFLSSMLLNSFRTLLMP